MIHKIKVLHDAGEGLSIRTIAKETGLSRNTVRKYLRMEELAISQSLVDTPRHKQLDNYSVFIKHLLGTYPEMTATKIMRKLRAKFPDLAASERTVRRYVCKVRKQVNIVQPRYYEPVLDMVPGQQIQVDPGELRGVMIGGVETTVYFVVFVLSYSRMMHVSSSLRPIDTSEFIRMHDAAFRYFGGRTAELVYDQTKLVVIKEKYRELELNQRFYEYATHAGFSIRACEGYDPESKGKVEAGVKYVKNNALYGEVFDSQPALDSHLADWLDTIANVRTHGTTGKVPHAHYEEMERHTMASYFTPNVVHSNGHQLTRKADKTGLISWLSNKYSVPFAWQRQEVEVKSLDSKLIIYDLTNGNEIAHHDVHSGKGKIIKNNHHYRDPAVKVAELEQALSLTLGEEFSTLLFTLLKKTSPKIYKDQLVGVKGIINRLGVPTAEQLITLCQRPKLTATQFEELLKAMQQAPERWQNPTEEKVVTGGLSQYQSVPLQGGKHDFY